LRFFTATGVLRNLQTCDISYCNGCKLIKFSVLSFNQCFYVSSSLLLSNFLNTLNELKVTVVVVATSIDLSSLCLTLSSSFYL
jgi:hypothetical protein